MNLGYLDDPFVKHFVKRPSRRPPLINRGSYLRTRSLDTFTEQFIKSDTNQSSTTTAAPLESVITQSASTHSPTTTATTTTPAAVAGIKKQIVSLGCGSDTRYFKFKVQHYNFDHQSAYLESEMLAVD